MPYTTHTQQAIPSSSRDEQATAQAELYTHLETQRVKNFGYLVIAIIR